MADRSGTEKVVELAVKKAVKMDERMGGRMAVE